MNPLNRKTLIQTLLLSHLALPASALANEHAHDHAQGHDHNADPLLTQVIIDQFEWRQSEDGTSHALSADAWLGKDLNKVWLKTDFEQRAGKTEDAELQALFSHAIAPYWDLQTGLRQDIEPNHSWVVLGIKGMAPHFFELDAAVFISDAGQAAARFSAEYEMLFTQRLILTPSIEVNLYRHNDFESSTGSGLSNSVAGLRLRYEIAPEFAPYLGANWQKKFGATADFAKNTGEAVNETSLVAGLRIWF